MRDTVREHDQAQPPAPTSPTVVLSAVFNMLGALPVGTAAGIRSDESTN